MICKSCCDSNEEKKLNHKKNPRHHNRRILKKQAVFIFMETNCIFLSFRLASLFVRSRIYEGAPQHEASISQSLSKKNISFCNDFHLNTDQIYFNSYKTKDTVCTVDFMKLTNMVVWQLSLLTKEMIYKFAG